MSTQISQILKNNEKFLETQNLSYLGLFGSYSRGEQGPQSDVDLLYEFNQPKSFFQLADLKNALEGLLGKQVDLVSKRHLKKNLHAYVYQDLITIYEKK